MTMTKQLREKLIPRRTSLLPRISSSYDGNHIEVDTANGNNRKNNDKWIEYICDFIHILSTIIQFSYPLVIIIVASLSYDSIIVTAVAFGLVLFKILVLDFYLFKMGKIQNWPNKIDMITATVYVLYGISDVMISRTNNQFRIVFDIVIDGVLTAYNGVAWLFGYPLGRIFVSDKVEDTVPFTHPVVIHFIQLTSRVMLCTFFLNFMLSIAAKVYYDHGEKETASAFSNFGLFLFVGMILFNSCYGFYFKSNIEKIAAKYEKRMNKQHHNNYHEMVNILKRKRKTTRNNILDKY